MLRLIAVVLILLFFAVPPGEARQLKIEPGSSHGALDVAGKKRTFRLYIPKGCDANRRHALVIVLHGGVGCSWSAQWDSRMSKQADKDHFIVVYPNGLLRTWNAGGCCGPARKMNVDDVGFMRALIERLKTELPVDADRVCVAGISNGGMMAYRLASELSDQIAAIAPIEACMYPAKSAPSAPVSVISVHGTADRIIKYDGGTGSMMGYKVHAQSVADTVQYWVKHDQCNPQAVRQENGSVVKDLYTNGKAGTEVCLYTLKEGGHVWPGGRRCIFVGDRPNKTFSATAAISEFFLSHPKQREVGYTSANQNWGR